MMVIVHPRQRKEAINTRRMACALELIRTDTFTFNCINEYKRKAFIDYLTGCSIKHYAIGVPLHFPPPIPIEPIQRDKDGWTL